MYRVLLVEDDRGIAEALCAQLGDWGFAVRAVENFRDVTGEFRAFDPQLVLLDLMLPFQSGYHWCAELRKISNVPVMFLSSAADNLNIVTAMNMGAEKIALSKNEYRILLCLMEQKGKVVSRERLMERLWESEAFVDENTLTVNVNRLRKKLAAAGLADFITTKFGVGYLVEDV